ncbi:MAG: PAS domain S-box protein [Planctomycetota bacterium]|nr:PAS domain S-box protein [Planctomycetota bacterium]
MPVRLMGGIVGSGDDAVLLLYMRDISEAHQARQKLAESEGRYRELVDNMTDRLYVIGTDGYFQFVNRAMEEGSGVSCDEWRRRHYLAGLLPQYGELVRTYIEAVLRGELLPPIEFSHFTADGRTVTVEASMRPLYEDGRIVGLQGVSRDITDRKRAEEALRESEARYRAVVESQTELICRFVAGGILTFVNESYCRYFGLSAADLVGRSFLPLLPESDRSAAADRLATIAATNPTVAHDHRVVLPSGEVRWMHWVNRGIFDEQGRAVEYQAVGWDFTDRKRAEEALQQSEARYRAILEDQTELVCRFLPDGTLTFVNEAVCRFVGKCREDMIGSGFLGYLTEEHRAALLEKLAALTPARPLFDDKEQATFLPSGETRWVHWTNRGIFDGQGCLTEIQGVGRDVTERRQAEEALRQSEENFRNLFEQSLDGIVVVGADGRIVSANQAFADIHGVAVSEVVGKHAADFMHPDDRAEGVERLAAAVRGESLAPSSRSWRDLRADGSIGLVEARSRGIRWAGRPAVQVILRDITERTRLEEELREAQKLEAVGQLAGGIAHDFNNLITGILCHAGLLKMNAESPSEVRETAGVIEGAARRAAQLTSSLLGFARRGKHQNVPVDLNAAVQACVDLFSRTLDPRIRVVTHLSDEQATVLGDPVQMEQVILNLALNARDAMPEGGEMVLATSLVHATEGGGRPDGLARPGAYVVLTVRDTGSGIPQELRSRIFEPFFTTKPPGKGIGMGLAMVYGIAKNHGGWVDLDPDAERGAAFRVFIPVATDLAEEKEAKVAAEPAAAARGRILVVDDEPLVRGVVIRMLAGLGYSVLSAADGKQAVDLYRKLGGEIGLVIIDMVMPEMNGGECFRALRALNPDVKAILSTGGPGDRSLQDILGEANVAFVQKPYEVRQLAEAVKLALGA